MSRAKVFVTQYSRRLDFTQLSRYGEVVFLTKKEYDPEPVPAEVNEAMKAEIAITMKDYTPGIDYIVTTGSAIPSLIVGKLLDISNNAAGSKHQILKWSNRDHKYEMYKL